MNKHDVEFIEKPISEKIQQANKNYELNTIEAIISAMQGGTDKALRRKLLEISQQDKTPSDNGVTPNAKNLTKILNHSCPEVTLRYIGAIK